MSDSELGVEGRDRLGLLNKFYISFLIISLAREYLCATVVPPYHP